MTILARITEDTSEAELLKWLHECSRYPQSPQRTASTDTLLDLWNEWVSVETVTYDGFGAPIVYGHRP